MLAPHANEGTPGPTPQGGEDQRKRRKELIDAYREFFACKRGMERAQSKLRQKSSQEDEEASEKEK